jgi:hypothetical protein
VAKRKPAPKDDTDKLLKSNKKAIKQEILKAVEAGKPWTPFRPFLNWVEKVGKVRCHPIPRPRNCLKNATHVSYCVGLSGCVALCNNCTERWRKSEDRV